MKKRNGMWVFASVADSGELRHALAAQGIPAVAHESIAGGLSAGAVAIFTVASESTDPVSGESVSAPDQLHFVDATGVTWLVLDARLCDIKGQAGLADIPEPRRPDEITAKRLGYV